MRASREEKSLENVGVSSFGAGVRPLRVVMVGHVDHGKSTLVGRLFYETKSLPEGRYEAIQEMCRRRSMPFEWAFLTDSLQAERDQGITIDTTQIWFKSAVRPYVIIDAPGHREFLKNMITGAASADAVVLLIDAAEGLREQSRRHAYLVHMLGIKQLVIVVNKMDKVAYEESRFVEVAAEIKDYVKTLGLVAKHIVPVSAQHGDHMTRASDNMAWYRGRVFIDALDSLEATPPAEDLPLRFHVQDVYKFDERRIIVGRIEGGTMRCGDKLLFSPVGLEGEVASFEHWPQLPSTQSIQGAGSGESVGVTLREQLFVERGMVGSLRREPPGYTHAFKADVFWLSKKPLVQGKTYRMRVGTAEYSVELSDVSRVIDTDDLASRHEGRHMMVPYNSVAEVTLRSRELMALDDHQAHPLSGRFVLRDGYHIAGGGIIRLDDVHVMTPQEALHGGDRHIYKVEHRVTSEHRAVRNHHKGGVIWLTGLSGAGKSTIAIDAERRLFLKGYQVYVLDGDNVRYGLNKDLGFTPEDRAENIRRVSEVAALMCDAGFIVIAAFISPYRDDRLLAAKVCGSYFREVYIKADVETCEARDPKGLYKKARKGVIPMFSGVSAPYEVPLEPDLIIDTLDLNLGESVSRLMGYVADNFVLERGVL
ncbi:MAG: adenylyl-sulfate kinase [Alphaproteobacteria bacterium GM7ARS4]|nr:adenylyl-sulfate kinase [Alphaproteobacteria bacterium GM7ARS4]